MINLEEVSVGDFIYAKLTIQEAPVFAEVSKILEKENAVEIRTDLWGTRVVIVQNAYWEEKLAKKSKRIKVLNNYKQWIKEMLDHEEAETDSGINSIHNGKPEKCEPEGETSGTTSVSKSTKRKPKVVRKSSTKKRKTRRNRKTSRSQKSSS